LKKANFIDELQVQEELGKRYSRNTIKQGKKHNSPKLKNIRPGRAPETTINTKTAAAYITTGKNNSKGILRND
jgi:hypothetical protein